MKLHFVLSIFSLTFFAIVAAASPILYKPVNSGATRGYYLSAGDYQEIRTDSDSDRVTKYWSVRKGDLFVDQTFRAGKIQLLRIRKIEKQKVAEIVYARKGSSLNLVSARVRKSEVYYYGGLFKNEQLKTEQCKARQELTTGLSDLVSKFDGDILQSNLSSSIIDASCKRDSAQYSLIEESLLTVMTPKNEFMACLSKDSTADQLSNNYKSMKAKDIKDELQMIGLKYSLQASKFMSQPESMKSMIKCKPSPKIEPPALCMESGQITYLAPADEKNLPTLEKYKEITFHETLHSLGLTADGVVDNIINVCFGRPQVEDKSTDKSRDELGILMGAGHFVPSDLTTEVASEVANKTNIAIDRKLAETAIPNPAPSELNRPFTNADAEVKSYALNPAAAATVAYKNSINSTSGLLNFAKSAIGSITPAIANPVQSRGLASVGPIGSTKSAGSRSSSINSKSDMSVVKEQIILGESSDASTVENPQAETIRRDETNPKSNSVRPVNAEVTANLPNPNFGSDRSLPSGARASFASVRSGTDSNLRSGRLPASQGSSQSLAVKSGVSRMGLPEIQKVLVNYNTAVKRLSDPSFRRVLKENKILIVDMADRVIFDPEVPNDRAAAVYLDTGSSFVRGKKK